MWKKLVSIVLALAICLGLTVPAMAAERTIRAMTSAEALQYVDFGPNTPIEKPADVLMEKEFRLDRGNLGTSTTKIGYYAIRKDVKFTLGNLGTPGGDSLATPSSLPLPRLPPGARKNSCAHV